MRSRGSGDVGEGARWGELRALLHGERAPALDEVWSLLVAFGPQGRGASINYVRHHLRDIAPDVTGRLDVFDEALLCDWSIHLVWWRLIGWAEWFEGEREEDVLALLLADVALLEHAASGFVSGGALELRRGELEVEQPYHRLEAHGFWVQQFVHAALHPEAVERVRALHDLCARWEAMPAASASLKEGVSRGVERLREVSPASLPSLLGGGRGITQFFGAGERFVRGVADTIGSMQRGVEEDRARVLSRIERWFAGYALDWLEVEQGAGEGEGGE